MKWIWDQEKNRTNKLKHGLSFETAALVFDDPLLLSRPDDDAGDERWQTIGVAESSLLFVVHTEMAFHDGEEVGRIISARRASRRERRAYEEGTF